jgi:hypothetical protein
MSIESPAPFLLQHYSKPDCGRPVIRPNIAFPFTAGTVMGYFYHATKRNRDPQPGRF